MKIDFCCHALSNAIANAELGLVYVEKFREYGIEYRDGGTSHQIIYFCPWCGTHLPDSLREQWFDELEKRGIDPLGPNVPADFETSKWWEGFPRR